MSGATFGGAGKRGFLASEFAKISLSADRRHALVISGELADQYVQRARLFWIDLESGERREIETHGDGLQFASLGPDGRVALPREMLGEANASHTGGRYNASQPNTDV